MKIDEMNDLKQAEASPVRDSTWYKLRQNWAHYQRGSLKINLKYNNYQLHEIHTILKCNPLRYFIYKNNLKRKTYPKIFLSFADQQIDGSDVEVTLAKPVDKEQRQQRAISKAMMAASSYSYPNPADYIIPYTGPSYPYTVNQPLYPFPTPMSR